LGPNPSYFRRQFFEREKRLRWCVSAVRNPARSKELQKVGVTDVVVKEKAQGEVATESLKGDALPRASVALRRVLISVAANEAVAAGEKGGIQPLHFPQE
jgi:hypothetical protein